MEIFEIIVIFGLLIVGVLIVGYGSIILCSANVDYEKAIQLESLKPITVYDSKFYYNPNPELNFLVFFETKDVFSVNNPMNVTMVVTIDESLKVNRIVAYTIDARNDESFTKTYSILHAEKSGTKFPKINLTKNTDGQFIGSEINSKVISEIEMAFVLIPYSNDLPLDSAFVINKFPRIIYPQHTNYEVQVYRDIQKQNIESSLTNSRVEGLTYIIIGLIPIQMFIQLIVDRFSSKPNENNI